MLKYRGIVASVTEPDINSVWLKPDNSLWVFRSGWTCVLQPSESEGPSNDPAHAPAQVDFSNLILILSDKGYTVDDTMGLTDIEEVTEAEVPEYVYWGDYKEDVNSKEVNEALLTALQGYAALWMKEYNTLVEQGVNSSTEVWLGNSKTIDAIIVPSCDFSVFEGAKSLFVGCENTLLYLDDTLDFSALTTTPVTVYVASALEVPNIIAGANGITINTKYLLPVNKNFKLLDFSRCTTTSDVITPLVSSAASIEELILNPSSNLWLNVTSANQNIEHLLVKNLRLSHTINLPNWGAGSEENRQSLVDTLITYSLTGNSAKPLSLSLPASVIARLTEDEILQVANKGATIVEI